MIDDVTAPSASARSVDAALAAPAPVPFGTALRFWLKLGCISFGGPAGQIALMHRELVERRRWISEQRFLHALNYCMLLPGPEAQQLATYLGWLMHRTWGGIAAGALFVLPSLFLLIGLSWLYAAHGQQPVVAGLFYGIKPAVAALVLHAVYRMAGKTLGNMRHRQIPWVIAAMSFVAIQGWNVAFPWLVLTAALVGWAGARWAPGQFGATGGHGALPRADSAHAPALIDDHTPTPPHARYAPRRLAQVLLCGVLLWLAGMAVLLLAFGWDGTATRMGRFFTQAALLTFGGAYAVLPYVVQGAVVQYGWLSSAQMMDGLALGETTPGPLIMVVAFVGFMGGWTLPMFGPDSALASAVLGACVATAFTFLPSFVFILAGGPLVEATHGKLGFTAPLAAISAALVGAITSLALLFVRHIAVPAHGVGTAGSGIDAVALLLAALAAVALIRYGQGVIRVITACAVAGLVARLAGWA